jgi:hypothetical protein
MTDLAFSQPGQDQRTGLTPSPEVAWRAGRASNTGADDDERQALWAEGVDPDDPAVIMAIDLNQHSTMGEC